MGTESNPKASPKVVKLDKALKLAEAWVSCMSGSTTGEPSELEFEGRPSGLGLGAKVAPNAKPVATTDPVERKLLGKLNAIKRQSSKNLEKIDAAEDGEPSEEDDDEPESRAKAFVKKRAMPLAASLKSIKRRK